MLAREHLGSVLPGLRLAKGLLFGAPIGKLLSAFVQALYVPSDDWGGVRRSVAEIPESEEVEGFERSC
jgi:hypothetical protein